MKKEILTKLGYTDHQDVITFLASQLEEGHLDYSSQSIAVNSLANPLR